MEILSTLLMMAAVGLSACVVGYLMGRYDASKAKPPVWSDVAMSSAMLPEELRFDDVKRLAEAYQVWPTSDDDMQRHALRLHAMVNGAIRLAKSAQQARNRTGEGMSSISARLNAELAKSEVSMEPSECREHTFRELQREHDAALYEDSPLPANSLGARRRAIAGT